MKVGEKVFHKLTGQEMKVKRCNNYPIYSLELKTPTLCEVTGEYINTAICHIDNLIYPMDYEEWLKQPKTKEALKIIKADFDRLDSGQLELF